VRWPFQPLVFEEGLAILAAEGDGIPPLTALGLMMPTWSAGARQECRFFVAHYPGRGGMNAKKQSFGNVE